MDLLIPDNWLKEYLKTTASPKKMAEALSLHGPSVERVNQTKFGPVYAIEVTSNRVDSVGVYGIAREAAAILPRMGIKASLKTLPDTKVSFAKKVDYLTASVDHNLCPRFAAILIRNVKLAQSPKWMCERIEAVGLRPINNIVDISNYIMHEIGQPVHTFDYDKIAKHTMILRASKKGEILTTLDEKSHTLPGGDIIIEDGDGRIIDLAGIMGGLNSAVDAKTKNVLLFVQTYNPVSIRRTSMTLAHKTEASILFEKGLDTNLVTDGIKRGIELFAKITQGQIDTHALDLYPSPPKEKIVSTNLDFIEKRLGVSLSPTQVSQFLTPLGFTLTWNKKNFQVKVPSWRNKDISLPEDILEEIARIYGYYKLPSILMSGDIPEAIPDSPFRFEDEIKLTLKSLGAYEIYTNSLVSEIKTGAGSLKLKNPLGKDGEYLRTTLRPSLIEAVKTNSFEKEPFHLFEMANVYLPRRGDLPDEKMTLAEIFANTDYREAKGIIETLLDSLHLKYFFETEDSQFFKPSHRLKIVSGQVVLGQFGQIENTNYIYYEFDLRVLNKAASHVGVFTPIPQYPPQIEDITITFPERTVIGGVIKLLEEQTFITKVELTDIYNHSYTFRINYQNPSKTLTDPEVEKIRKNLLKLVQDQFGGTCA